MYAHIVKQAVFVCFSACHRFPLQSVIALEARRQSKQHLHAVRVLRKVEQHRAFGRVLVTGRALVCDTHRCSTGLSGATLHFGSPAACPCGVLRFTEKYDSIVYDVVI